MEVEQCRHISSQKSELMQFRALQSTADRATRTSAEQHGNTAGHQFGLSIDDDIAYGMAIVVIEGDGRAAVKVSSHELPAGGSSGGIGSITVLADEVEVASHGLPVAVSGGEVEFVAHNLPEVGAVVGVIVSGRRVRRW
ncbi:hypothetical protein Droror1_Dr00014571 [Drosera rotundifolia]